MGRSCIHRYFFSPLKRSCCEWTWIDFTKFPVVPADPYLHDAIFSIYPCITTLTSLATSRQIAMLWRLPFYNPRRDYCQLTLAVLEVRGTPPILVVSAFSILRSNNSLMIRVSELYCYTRHILLFVINNRASSQLMTPKKTYRPNIHLGADHGAQKPGRVLAGKTNFSRLFNTLRWSRHSTVDIWRQTFVLRARWNRPGSASPYKCLVKTFPLLAD